MTASDTRIEVWKAIPGFSAYEACSLGGRVRSVDRVVGLRAVKGVQLTPKRTGTSRYWQVKVTGDDGRQRTRPVHQLVLEAHVGPCPPGMEACHGDDNPAHNDLANLRWDYPAGNDEDRRRNHPPPPPKPPPARQCIRCGESFHGNGRRCHLCVVTIGVTAAELLASGVTLERAAAQLEYPSLDGLHTLARRHGGYGLSWSRRVRRRWVAWLAGGDAR